MSDNTVESLPLQGRIEVALDGLDSVAGSLDLYAFDNVPDASEVVELQAVNRVDPVLSTASAHDLGSQ